MKYVRAEKRRIHRHATDRPVSDFRMRTFASLLFVASALLPIRISYAAVTADILYDVATTDMLVDWTEDQSAGGVITQVGINFDTTGKRYYYLQEFAELETGNAFAVEAVVNTSTTANGTEHGARLAVDFRDAGESDAYRVEIRFERDASGVPHVRLWWIESLMANLELDLGSVDFEQTNPRIRIRFRRQQVAGIDYLVLEAEPSSDPFVDPNDDVTNDPPARLVVADFQNVLLPESGGHPGSIRFGHGVDTGAYQSSWEYIHINFTDAPDTLLPYWTPCDTGYVRDGIACIDVDECADQTDDCDTNAACENTTGSYTCSCNSGYSGDGTTCAEIDACIGDPCDDDGDTGANCTDLAPPSETYSCACSAGYIAPAEGGSCAAIDTDGDGVPDSVHSDVCGDGESVGCNDNCPANSNPGQEDSDDDALGDACDDCPADPDNDVDGDLVCGDVDNCPADSNSLQEDPDGDGAGTACDVCPLDSEDDRDGDGHCANVDNCPNRSNPGQGDTDSDGHGDVCDRCPTDPGNDPDWDSVCTMDDNCWSVWNPDQADTDGDGIGDACDDDTPDGGVSLDGGGLPDMSYSPDVAAAEDAGPSLDAAWQDDAGVTTDGGSTTEAGSDGDASSEADGGGSSDAHMSVDAGSEVDAGAFVDATVATDTGQMGDASGNADAASIGDAAELSDRGIAPDTSTSSDTLTGVDSHVVADAGVGADAETGELVDSSADTGCGCSSAGNPATAAFATFGLIALGLGRARWRRCRRPHTRLEA